jgi:hypothetical protein
MADLGEIRSLVAETRRPLDAAEQQEVLRLQKLSQEIPQGFVRAEHARAEQNLQAQNLQKALAEEKRYKKNLKSKIASSKANKESAKQRVDALKNDLGKTQRALAKETKAGKKATLQAEENRLKSEIQRNEADYQKKNNLFLQQSQTLQTSSASLADPRVRAIKTYRAEVTRTKQAETAAARQTQTDFQTFQQSVLANIARYQNLADAALTEDQSKYFLNEVLQQEQDYDPEPLALRTAGGAELKVGVMNVVSAVDDERRKKAAAIQLSLEKAELAQKKQQLRAARNAERLAQAAAAGNAGNAALAAQAAAATAQVARVDNERKSITSSISGLEKLRRDDLQAITADEKNNMDLGRALGVGGRGIDAADADVDVVLENPELNLQLPGDLQRATAQLFPEAQDFTFSLATPDVKFAAFGGVAPRQRYMYNVPDLSSAFQAPYLSSYTPGAAVGLTGQGPLSVTAANAFFGTVLQPTDTYIPPKDGVGAASDLSFAEKLDIGLTQRAPDLSSTLYKPYYPTSKKQKLSKKSQSELDPVLDQMLKGYGMGGSYVVSGKNNYTTPVFNYGLVP